MSDATEAPTPRRLAQARREGDGGATSAASHAAALVTVALLLPAAVVTLAETTNRGLRDAFAAIAAPAPRVVFEAATLAKPLLAVSAPLLVAVAVTSLMATLTQTGGRVAVARLAPRMSRLSPAGGARRFFSASRLLGAARAVTASVVVGAIAWLTLHDHAADLARSAGEPRYAWALGLSLGGAVLLRGAAAAVALGVVDLAVTRWAWMNRLRMTREAVRRDLREAEGDPDVRTARRRAHADLLRGARLADVAAASLLVTGRSGACALAYEGDDAGAAPLVVASGVASELERVARERGVPIVADDALARVLLGLEIGQEIPESLYEDVALAFRDARG